MAAKTKSKTPVLTVKDLCNAFEKILKKDGRLAVQKHLTALADTADKHPDSWITEDLLIVAARNFICKEFLDGSPTPRQAQARLDHASRLIATLLDTKECGAFCHTTGTRCAELRAACSLTCDKHLEHGLQSFVKSKDGNSDHPLDQPCYSCNSVPDDDEKALVVSCSLCSVICCRTCFNATHPGTADVVQDGLAMMLCDYCCSHRLQAAILFTNHDIDGIPANVPCVEIQYGAMKNDTEDDPPPPAAEDPAADDSNQQEPARGKRAAGSKKKKSGSAKSDKRQRKGASADEYPPMPRARTAVPADGRRPDAGGDHQESELVKMRALFTAIVNQVDELRKEVRNIPAPARATQEGHPHQEAATGASSMMTSPMLLVAEDEAYLRTPAPPADFQRSLKVPWSDHSGAKPSTDAQGNPLSSVKHPYNPGFPQSFDYLGNKMTSSSKSFRENLNIADPPTGGIQSELTWEAFCRAAMDHLWSLLHVVNVPEVDVQTERGRRTEYTLLLTIARIKTLVATVHRLKALANQRSRTLQWKTIYNHLQDVVTTRYATGIDTGGLDDFTSRLVLKLCTTTRQGQKPTLHDHLQKQLEVMQMGWTQLPAEQPTPPPHAGRPPTQTPRSQGPPICPLCRGPHTLAAHPPGAPITVPCFRCRALHARTGPLASACQSGGNPVPPPAPPAGGARQVHRVP